MSTDASSTFPTAVTLGGFQNGVSVVIPVYNSAATLPELLERLRNVLRTLATPFEIILIDDCSSDTTWEVLKALRGQYSRVLKIARLQRNSGQHNAILCGFSLARGAVVVTMDDDLQNPPEEIPKLLAMIEEGYDLVIGAYGEKQHSKMRNASGGIVDRVIRRIFGLPLDFQLTSFRAVRGHVINSVRQMGGIYPYVTTMLLSHTSNYTNTTVRHDPRRHGISNYNLSKSIRLVLNLIFNYSTIPVTFVGCLCIAALGFAVIFGGWVLIRALTESSAVQGWASTVVVISFFSALNLMCLFIFALYLSRMNQQLTRSRVAFTISELHDD